MKGKKYFPRLSMFAKFSLVIILVGIVPISLFVAIIQHRMIEQYRSSLLENYNEALQYISYSIAAKLETYDNLSKTSYYYSPNSVVLPGYEYQNYDTLRKILTGEAFGEQSTETQVEQEMQNFLRTITKVNANIEAVHFLYKSNAGEEKLYHTGNYLNRYFDNQAFRQQVDTERLNVDSRELLIFPTHPFDYVKYNSTHTDQVVTVGRNYYDITGVIGQEKYVGTLFIDIRVDDFNQTFSKFNLSSGGTIYVTEQSGYCLFSSNEENIGHILNVPNDPENLVLSNEVPEYELTVWCNLSDLPIETQIRNMQSFAYLFIGIAVLALVCGSVFFSRQLTKPLSIIMEEMKKVESGQFKGEIPVISNDEVGKLTERFNEMTRQLENYTNQVYVSKIRQTEAELNALKSQIYPHFLYNTLEIIRMTAVGQKDELVAEMIEALSDQIRYLIGTVTDLVPLRNEVKILQKYIFLINCGFDNKVELTFDCADLMDMEIPKLILQPLVENAFVHGIKPIEGKGRILVRAQQEEGLIYISVMDNGAGISKQQLEHIETILNSELPGDKKNYQWKSIGLKNVHDRLRYLYGEPCGVSIASTPDVGTLIKITLPASLNQNKRRGLNV